MKSDSPSPAEVWKAAYGELQLQIPRETFDTWLRDARLVAHEDGTYIIGVRNVYAREWLERRLKPVIVRTISAIARRSVEVRFVVWQQPETLGDDPGPLLAPPPERPAAFRSHTPEKTGLNPHLTFDNFVVGPSNRLAHAAALEITEAPGERFNPLYLYGGVGIGKSHLLHAIGNACLAAGMAVLYAPSETFTNDLVAAIRSHRTEEFRQKYRGVDALLVDGVQFLVGKESTQEEFYHTFNALYDARRQLVLAADRPPASMAGLDERLRSRFEGGLLAGIAPPGDEERFAILQAKAAGKDLSPAILELIADRVEGSARELEGALNRVMAGMLITGESPTLQQAEAALGELARERRAPSLEDVVVAVSNYYGVDLSDVRGPGRAREVSVARQVIMYLAREHAGISLQQIGMALGGRNHSTILYGCERVADLLATDSLLREQIETILQTLLPSQRCAPL
jgi:chromosomal replication initiator protein